MRYFPIHLDLQDRVAVVVGGGKVAEGKALQLLQAGAHVRIVSPDVTETLAERIAAGLIQHINREFHPGDIDGAHLVITATDSRDVNSQVLSASRERGIWCNAVDQPDLCDFITPALIERGSLQIGISTSGESPVLAQRVKREIGDLIGDEYGVLLKMAARMRKRAKRIIPDFDIRRDVLRAFVESQALELIRRDEVDKAQAIVEKLLSRFEAKQTRSIDEALEWASETFADGLVMTSNFGAEGVVLIDHLARIAPRTPIIYIDTGYQFAATDELKEQLRARYDLNIIEVRSPLTVAMQAARFGDKLYSRDPDLCCKMRKVEPLAEALNGKRAWLTALRRDSSPTRASLESVEWNDRHGLVKINPMADWTRAQVWNYISKHGLPYNRLYDEGYGSIGCEPCTRRVQDGEHERSGRWDGNAKLECGIHL